MSNSTDLHITIYFEMTEKGCYELNYINNHSYSREVFNVLTSPV